MHWCDKSGIYFDLFGRSSKNLRHNFINHKTAAAFWPLISRVADESRSGALKERLLDPGDFNTPHPVPSLSRDDPNYNPLGAYWLGGVWAPANYMIVRGLSKYGITDLAREIAVRHLDYMVKVMNDRHYGGIWECYSPEHPRPSNKYSASELVRGNFVGWSGLGPVAMLIENIFGFSFDARKNLIGWRINTEGSHGIRNLLFNGRKLSLVCIDDPGGKTVHVENSKKISLSIDHNGRRTEHVLEKGSHKIPIS